MPSASSAPRTRNWRLEASHRFCAQVDGTDDTSTDKILLGVVRYRRAGGKDADDRPIVPFQETRRSAGRRRWHDPRHAAHPDIQGVKGVGIDFGLGGSREGGRGADDAPVGFHRLILAGRSTTKRRDVRSITAGLGARHPSVVPSSRRRSSGGILVSSGCTVSLTRAIS